MAESEYQEQVVEAQEDVQKGCFGSFLALVIFFLVSISIIFIFISG